MKKIVFHFFDKDLTVSQAIEHFTGKGNKSHVKIEFSDDKYFIEAIGGRLFGPSGIVASSELTSYHDTEKLKVKHFYKIEIEVPDAKYAAAKEYAVSCEGDKYGYAGLVPFIIRFLPLKHQGKYCSQLALEIFTKATGVLPSIDQSPNSLFDVISAYKSGSDSKFIKV